MKISEINQYLTFLNELYITLKIESTVELYGCMKDFNKNWSEKKVKAAIFYLLEWILSDGSHHITYEGITYNKENGNWRDFIKIYSNVYDELIEYVNNGAIMGPPEEYNEVIRRNVYFLLNPSWTGELCKLKKMGYMNAYNHKENCKFHPYYQYQMPAHRFIPDNDCGFEE